MNNIIFREIDGIPQRSDFSSGKFITYSAIIRNVRTIQISTEKELQVGDFVIYKDMKIKIFERIYYSEYNNFDFYGNDVYVDRRSEDD